ncbi:hypothetical protein Tco_1326120 [Tanacetum coccineum]
MSSVTAQQTKLNMELVPKEKRLEIEKYNERLNPGKKHREPTFQVVMDALAFTPCYSVFLITTDVPEVYMHQFWDAIHKYENSYTFRMDKKKKFDLNLEIFRDIFQICPRVHELGHTRKSKICINLGELLPPSSTEVYLERQLVLTSFVFLKYRSFEFKKPTSPKLSTVQASPDEPTRKSKRVKRPAKKSSDAPTTGVVIRETHVKSLSKKKEKMTVEKRKGIDLLSEVALTEEAYAAKIKPSVTNKGTGVKPGVPDVTEEESTESEAESWERMKMTAIMNMTLEVKEVIKKETVEEEEEDEFVKTSSNDTDDEDETKIKDKTEGDEDEGMDYATNQFDDDVNVRLNEPVETDEGLIQKEGTDAEMTNKTKVPVTSSSHSSDLAFKFLNFLDIPHIDAEIVSPMDVHVHHEVPSKQTPTLLTVPVSVITDSSPVYSTVIPQSLPSFTPPPQQSTLTPPTTTKATYPLSTLPNFASVF